MAELFQTSLFGYSKKNVCAYIAELNEGFSSKLMEKDVECQNTINELKSMLEQLRRENEQLQAERREVAGALIDAKAFAAGLMEQADEEAFHRQAKLHVVDVDHRDDEAAFVADLDEVLLHLPAVQSAQPLEHGIIEHVADAFAVVDGVDDGEVCGIHSILEGQDLLFLLR